MAAVTRATNGSQKAQTWSLTWDRSRTVAQPIGWTTGDGGGGSIVNGLGPALAIEFESGRRAERVRVGPLGDIVGSAVAVADEFDPFGNSGETDRFGLGYRGGLHIGPTINFGVRDMNPALGRFVTPDPVAAPSGAAASSRYAYAANDPINLIDPLGMSPTDNSFALFVEEQIDSFSVEDFGKGVLDYGLDGLRDLVDLGKLAWSGAKCTAAKVTFGLVGSCDEIKALVEGALELGRTVYNAVKNRNLGAILDIIQGFLPDRCQLNASFELDYCAGYATAAIIAKAVTAGVGAASELGVLGRVGDLVPQRLDDAVTDVARYFPEDTPGLCSAFSSFSGDTAVVMTDGAARPLSEVGVGDRVLATDPQTGWTGARAVTAVWVHPDQLIDLHLEGGMVVTTEDHPFWNETDGEWQRADQLEPGDRLLDPDGETTTVVGLDPASARVDLAYNLTVDATHTYHVAAGPTAVLVHNTGGPGRCDPLVEFAENNRATGFASEYTSPAGNRYYDITANRGPIAADGPLGAPHHGGCSEIGCLLQAVEAEGPAGLGGDMRTIRNRPANSPVPAGPPTGLGTLAIRAAVSRETETPGRRAGTRSPSGS